MQMSQLFTLKRAKISNRCQKHTQIGPKTKTRRSSPRALPSIHQEVLNVSIETNKLSSQLRKTSNRPSRLQHHRDRDPPQTYKRCSNSSSKQNARPGKQGSAPYRSNNREFSRKRRIRFFWTSSKCNQTSPRSCKTFQISRLPKRLMISVQGRIARCA